MKPRKEHNRIIGPSGCISKEGLFLYLRNELTEKEKNSFEQHVSGCLLCHEALEGYEKHAGSDKFITGSGSIQKGLKSTFAGTANKSLKKSGAKRTLITTISIAASFLLVFMGYYLITTQTKTDKKEISLNAPIPEEKTISDKQITTEAPEDIVKEAKKDVAEETLAEQKMAELKGKGERQDNEQDKFRAPTTIAVTGESKDADHSGIVFGATGTKAEGKQDVYNGLFDGGLVLGGAQPAQSQGDSTSLRGVQQETVLAMDQRAIDEVTVEKNSSLKSLEEKKPYKKESGKTKNVTTVASANRSENKQTLTNAISYYNSAQYGPAITEFEKSVKENTNDDQALYYLAMSYYNNGQKDAALPYLDKLLKKKDNPFYDLALWQKATILAEKNQTGAALELFDEIVKRGGTLKNNAAEKINELDKSE
ncbi:MAG TPA: tetratricopeptide repeat protein [Bacteroidales bacterium]|nr:tetratricopeptide repeat protein [Bacteroidales bacterium]